MKVLVDTTVWSHSFRRRLRVVSPESEELLRLINQNKATLIGPIRQELLCGIADFKQFVFLRDLMSAFVDEPLYVSDFELGAHCFNQCRAKGIQGTHTDFLICAVAMGRKLPIFSADKDFSNYAKVLPIQLHSIVNAT